MPSSKNCVMKWRFNTIWTTLLCRILIIGIPLFQCFFTTNLLVSHLGKWSFVTWSLRKFVHLDISKLNYSLTAVFLCCLKITCLHARSTIKMCRWWLDKIVHRHMIITWNVYVFDFQIMFHVQFNFCLCKFWLSRIYADWFII